MENQAVVSVQMSKTINLGNYNSKKVGISLSMPCNPKDIDKTYQKSVQWIEERLNADKSEAISVCMSGHSIISNLSGAI